MTNLETYRRATEHERAAIIQRMSAEERTGLLAEMELDFRARRAAAQEAQRLADRARAELAQYVRPWHGLAALIDMHLSPAGMTIENLAGWLHPDYFSPTYTDPDSRRRSLAACAPPPAAARCAALRPA